MSDDELQQDVLSKVQVDRRTFVKRALLGTAFAVPVVASFEMTRGDAKAFHAFGANQTFAANQCFTYLQRRDYAGWIRCRVYSFFTSFKA
jgi:hypothetical protein